MENTPKFPYNLSQVAGTITQLRIDDSKTKANIDVKVPHGEKQSPRYLRIFITGEDKIKNLESAIAEFKANVSQTDNVPIMAKGLAFLDSNNGNTNFSCIVNNKLEQNNDSFFIPRSKEQLAEFDKTYTSKSYENTANVKLFGRLTEDPKIIPSAKGNFAEISVAHNYYKGNDENRTKEAMFAKVIIPSSQLDQFQATGFVKGTAVNLDASIQPRSYENKAGEKKYTVNLVSNSIAPDLSKLISKGAAAEMVESVANENKKAERIQKADELSTELGTKKQNKKSM